MNFFGKLLGEKLNTCDGKLLYMAGGATEGLKKKKVSGCQFFPFHHPLGAAMVSDLAGDSDSDDRLGVSS
jgi:hypothetical protein